LKPNGNPDPHSFLGFLEAGITPAFTIVTSQWYRKNEQGTRTGIWFSCNALSLTLGAFIAYGFAEADLSGDLSLPGWQVIFIFMGCLTTAMGVVLAIWLPDSPLTARFLSPEDREIAIERIRGNQQSLGHNEYKLYQVKEAFLDPMVSGIRCGLFIDPARD
jgi:ACS family allantoate permease-like MFS transporter